MRLALLLWICWPVMAMTQQSLMLPTANDTLYRGGGPDFYMYVDRNFKGQQSKPWEAGQYGLVRNPMDSAAGVINTKFHEGIDIKPARRDKQGSPLDKVVAVSDGRVVHVSEIAGRSNYGKYIVVEHQWDGCPYYSLYAHLRQTNVVPGAHVKQGDMLGVLGWTGAGINKERAHLHLEIALMINSRFEDLYNDGKPSSPNYHGNYSGLNLIGIDVAKFYLARKNNPALTISEFLRQEPAFFRVLIPTGPGIELIKRYPWLAEGHAAENPPSWELFFTETGVPVKAVPSDVQLGTPRLSGIKNSTVPYQYLTRQLVSGKQGSAQLSDSGLRAMKLITYPN